MRHLLPGKGVDAEPVHQRVGFLEGGRIRGRLRGRAADRSKEGQDSHESKWKAHADLPSGPVVHGDVAGLCGDARQPRRNVRVGVEIEAAFAGDMGVAIERDVGEAVAIADEERMTREMLLTDPEQAADFVKKTGVDALAIAIGTSHGAYKFTRKPTGDILAIERIKEIHRRIPNTHLVMHGSSSVPQDLLAVIRANGGESLVIGSTYRVDPAEHLVMIMMIQLLPNTSDIAERFSAYDFRTVARALGHLHTTEKLWQDPRGKMCVRGSDFAAKPPPRR